MPVERPKKNHKLTVIKNDNSFEQEGIFVQSSKPSNMRPDMQQQE